MTLPNPSMRRLAEIDARAASCPDPRLRADVLSLVRLIANLIAMHTPTAEGRFCGECARSRDAIRSRGHRPPVPCRTRWLLDVTLGRA
ncbi:MAG: hypothetical protein ACRDT1_08750 [Micromonosporaceae bacterium]